MSDSTPVIADLLLTANTAGQAAKANDLFNSTSPAALYARNPATTTGLTWGYIGGRYHSASISNGTVSLTGSSDNYVVAAISDGAVSVSTSTTNWNNQTAYMRLYKIVAGSGSITSYEDHRSPPPPPSVSAPAWQIQIACSDETTALTTGEAKVTFRMPRAMTLTAVRASLSTAQATDGGGGIFTVDIKEGGSSILSTKLTIDNTEKTSTTAATPAVISDSALADDAEITIDIDQVGDGTAKGLKVALIGT